MSFKIVEELYNRFGKDKKLLSTFYDNDYPVPIKGLYLYPLTVDTYIYFYSLVGSIGDSKNMSGDIEAISTSYLGWLYKQALRGDYDRISRCLLLLKLAFKLEGDDGENIDIITTNNGKNYNLKIKDTVFDEQEFDEIRKIICEQNGYEMVDESVHPDWYKAQKEMEEYRAKHSNFKMCSLGDRMNVIISRGVPKSEVLKMTIRTFDRLIERTDLIMNYELMTLLSPNLEKKDREKIIHYLSDTTQIDKFADIKVDYDEMKNKIEK